MMNRTDKKIELIERLAAITRTIGNGIDRAVDMPPSDAIETLERAAKDANFEMYRLLKAEGWLWQEKT